MSWIEERLRSSRAELGQKERELQKAKVSFKKRDIQIQKIELIAADMIWESPEMWWTNVLAIYLSESLFPDDINNYDFVPRQRNGVDEPSPISLEIAFEVALEHYLEQSYEECTQLAEDWSELFLDVSSSSDEAGSFQAFETAAKHMIVDLKLKGLEDPRVFALQYVGQHFLPI